MYCNYEYPGKIKKIEPDVRSPCTLSCTLPQSSVLLSSQLRSLVRHVCTLPQTLDLAHEMCEKAKTIGDPENQDILNRLCKLLERRLAKKKEKDTGGTGKRNAGLVRVISIRARTHDTHTCATHVPTRSMTWTLTNHTSGPLSSLTPLVPSRHS